MRRALALPESVPVRRAGARIGILSRVNHVTSALRIGEQSESLVSSPDPTLSRGETVW